MGTEYLGGDTRIGASSNSSSYSASGDHGITAKTDKKADLDEVNQNANILLFSSKHDDIPILDTSVISEHKVYAFFVFKIYYFLKLFFHLKYY